MILSGHILLDRDGCLNCHEPLQLFKHRRNAETSGFATRGRGQFLIVSARPFFATTYGKTCLAIIRKRMDEGYYNPKPKPIESGATLVHTPPSTLSGLSAFARMQLQLSELKAKKRLTALNGSIDASILRDKPEKKDRESHLLLETGAAQDLERSRMASKEPLPALKKPRSPRTLDFLSMHSSLSGSLQIEIDKRAKSLQQIGTSRKRLASPEKRIPEKVRFDLLVLFRAGESNADLNKLVKRYKLKLK